MPEKLKSASSAEWLRAEWKGYFFGSPVRASFSSSGPPGYGRPRALATLSKASPAASSRVWPRSLNLS